MNDSSVENTNVDNIDDAAVKPSPKKSLLKRIISIVIMGVLIFTSSYYFFMGEDLNKNIEQLSDRNDKISKQKDEIQKQYDDILSKYRDTQDQIESLNTQLSDLQENHDALQEENESLKSKNKKLQEKVDNLESKTNKMSSVDSSGGSGQLQWDTSESEESTDEGSGTVYWTSGGSVYHSTDSCPSLARSKTIYSGSKSESGKLRACKNCY